MGNVNKGAVNGALYGSIFGPLGMAIGAAVGADARSDSHISHHVIPDPGPPGGDIFGWHHGTVVNAGPGVLAIQSNGSLYTIIAAEYANLSQSGWFRAGITVRFMLVNNGHQAAHVEFEHDEP